MFDARSTSSSYVVTLRIFGLINDVFAWSTVFLDIESRVFDVLNMMICNLVPFASKSIFVSTLFWML
jgi:hypothetical protein